MSTLTSSEVEDLDRALKAAPSLKNACAVHTYGTQGGKGKIILGASSVNCTLADITAVVATWSRVGRTALSEDEDFYDAQAQRWRRRDTYVIWVPLEKPPPVLPKRPWKARACDYAGLGVNLGLLGVCLLLFAYVVVPLGSGSGS